MTIRYAEVDQLAINIDALKTTKGKQAALLAEDLMAQARIVINRQRARALADMKFLEGVSSMRDIARELDVSPNAVSLWLKDFGPKFYWTIRQEGDDLDNLIAERVPRGEVRRLVQAGRRAIPAAWGLGDQEQLEGPLAGYWHALAGQA